MILLNELLCFPISARNEAMQTSCRNVSRVKRPSHRFAMLFSMLMVIPTLLPAQGIPRFELRRGSLELGGPANSWRFIHAVGEKSGLWGFENGDLESWVYPLKIFHDFRLEFLMGSYPRIWKSPETLRSVRVLPQMVQLEYSAEQFTVVETLFTPRDQPGSVILLDIKAPAALKVFVHFQPDLNLMWPGGIGGQSAAWDDTKKWVELSEPTNRYLALVGSPFARSSTAVRYHAYLPNEYPDEIIELDVSPQEAARFYVPIVIAGGLKGKFDAASTYELLHDLPQMYAESLEHYEALDTEGTYFQTPDREVNEALRWSRVSLDQLKVCNPDLGCSEVSGYGSSGTGTRPMYAWFFDEPSITAPAYLEYAGADNLRQAFRFLQKYQRADGKIPHEISQSAGQIDWFKDYPYPYIHPDTSAGYLIAMEDYYRFTADLDFLRESWPSIQKAYQYCVSLLDPQDGLPLIPKGEWGSTEVAAFSKDSSMAGEWVTALGAMHDLSLFTGQSSLAKECEERQQLAAKSLEKEFWNSKTGFYDYGRDGAGQPVTSITPALAFTAARGVFPPDHSHSIVERLSSAALMSDWGERDMSIDEPDYSEGSYHVGSVWPLFTAAAILSEYRYHNSIQAFASWMSMIHLREFNARGAMPEVFSGRFFRLLDNAVPHQMFSEVAIIPGLVNGMLGLDTDAPRRSLRLAPHLPPDWPAVSVNQFPFGVNKMNLTLRQKSGVLNASLEFTGAKPVQIEYAPALPAGSTIISVLQDGKPAPFKVEDDASDVHAIVRAVATRKCEIEVRYAAGVALLMEWHSLHEGDSSENLRIIRSAYRNGGMQLLVEGLPDRQYELRIFSPWGVKRSKGVECVVDAFGARTLVLEPQLSPKTGASPSGYTRWAVDLQFQK
jgi:glycogen debranching enzyme